MRVILKHNKGVKWYESGNLIVKGHFYNQNDEYYEGENLINYFKKIITIDDLRNKLKRANGVFSLIIKFEGKICLYSDKTRFYTLFYSKSENDYIISDSVDSIVEETGSFNIYNPGLEHFYGTGFVIGDRTLIDGVFQVQSSELLIIQQDGQKKSEFLFDIKRKEFFLGSEDELLISAKLALEKAFNRMANSIKGRQVVIPLSGGFDSRFIATFMKEAGIKDVLCFTYGKPDYHEVEVSKEVAKRLGYKWLFFDHTKKDFISLKNDSLFYEYISYSAQYSSMFYLSEYFATRDMYKSSVIEKNSVFIPGHYGDVAAGSQYFDVFDDRLTIHNFYKKYAKARFIYNSPNHSDIANIIKNVNMFVDIEKEAEIGYDIRTVFEDLDNREKISKFVTNSAKVFSFFGYDVLFPFGDDVFMDFFSKVPYKFRKYKRLYDDLLTNTFFKKYNVSFEDEIISMVRRRKLQEYKKYLKPFVPQILKKGKITKNDWPNYVGITTDMRAENKLKDPAYGNPMSLNSIIINWYCMKIKEKAGLL